MNLDELGVSIHEVDALNLKCYENIAAEYGDLSHETCRDFDLGTQYFLQDEALKKIEPELKNGLNYLDVGVGTGITLDCMMPWLEKMQAHIEVLDISKKMLAITKEKYGDKISRYHHTSIHNFKALNKYDLIFAALCDPYLTKEAIQILKNSLTKDGIMMLTLPTHTWSIKVRKESVYRTTFHDKNRNEYTSFSFCWSKGDLIKYIESCGLCNKYSLVVLVDEIQKRKSKLSSLNNQLLLNETRVPMLLALIFLNKEK